MSAPVVAPIPSRTTDAPGGEEIREQTHGGAQQWLAVGLWICLSGGALAFGGTAPLAWAAVQLLAFVLLVLVIWSSRAPLPWKGPALLLGYAVCQTAVVPADVHRAREQLLRLLAYLCVFCVAACIARSDKPRRHFLQGLLALGLFEALYGLVQYASGWQQIFTYKKVFYTQAATGTYINPNHFAGLLEMLLPLAFAWTLRNLERLDLQPRRRRSSLIRTLESEGLPQLALSSFCTVLLFVAIFCSRSRSGILSAAIGVLFVGVVWFFAAPRSTAAALVPAALLVGVAAFVLWFGLGPVLERFEGTPRDISARLSVWRDALHLVHAHPFAGVGLGMFADAYTRVQTVALSSTVDHAHNDYVELAVEWGLPGAALVVGALLFVLARASPACFRAARRSERLTVLGCCGGIVALLLHSFTDFNLQIPANALVFAALLGTAYATGAGTLSASVVGKTSAKG
jgi:O-antigen ligase